MVPEAVAAVDRTVSARLKGKRGLFAAVGADGREAFSRAATAAAMTAATSTESAASAALRFAGRSTRRAALRLVHEAALLVSFLLSSREHEGRSALNAGDVLVGKRHTLTCKWPIGSVGAGVTVDFRTTRKTAGILA
jgi:hypothetical protein